MTFRLMVVAVCASVLLQGCSLLGIETCGLGASRCKGNTVQVCKTGFSWTDSVSCDDVAAGEGGKWTCGSPKGTCQETFQCLPVVEKSEPAPAPKPVRAEKKESPRGSR
jgi:hypothetical protein